MKFSTFATSFVAAAVFFSSSALAGYDSDDLMYSDRKKCYNKGQEVEFYFECEEHERIYVDVYQVGRGRINNLRTLHFNYNGRKRCSFNWVVENSLSDGDYFMEVCTQDSSDSDDYSDDDECYRSSIFQVGSGRRGNRNRNRYDERDISSLGGETLPLPQA